MTQPANPLADELQGDYPEYDYLTSPQGSSNGPGYTIYLARHKTRRMWLEAYSVQGLRDQLRDEEQKRNRLKRIK